MTDAQSSPTRVRFSPSPTGVFHVGSARTALFNWLHVQKHGGVFILRIEDTDERRNKAHSVEAILDGLRWLNLEWDEGPFFQSQNIESHVAAAEALFASGRAYYCDCAPENLAGRKDFAQMRTPGYDGYCRDRGLAGAPGTALRFATPRQGTLIRTDLIRGTSSIPLGTIEDFVLLRGDGTPTFILANTVDDIAQRVSHVIRGEEHLPNVPKQMLLWEALGADQHPIYAHLPLILNDRRQKLSKRRDKVDVTDYCRQGYLPEAMLNYLALLGWSPRDDEEHLSLEQLVARFSLEDVKRSSAFFDARKLRALNADYLRRLSAEEFIERTIDWCRNTIMTPLGPQLQERARVLSDGLSMADFLISVPPPVIDERSLEGLLAQHAVVDALGDLGHAYQDCEWEPDVLADITREIAARHAVSTKWALAALRMAVTGRTVGPPLFESISVLGRERTVERVEILLDRMNTLASPGS